MPKRAPQGMSFRGQPTWPLSPSAAKSRSISSIDSHSIETEKLLLAFHVPPGVPSEAMIRDMPAREICECMIFWVGSDGDLLAASGYGINWRSRPRHFWLND